MQRFDNDIKIASGHELISKNLFSLGPAASHELDDARVMVAPGGWPICVELVGVEVVCSQQQPMSLAMHG